MKHFFDKIKYKFDQFLSKGTVALVLSLFLLMFIIVFGIGVITYLFNPDSNLGGMIWSSFMQTLDPGNLSGETGTILYMIMMTLATIVGIFITSLFISFILNGFQNRLENLSRGRSKVIEKNHTLILGWDDNIYVILSELIEANRSIRHPVIVILSDLDSVEMNQLIKDNLRTTFNTKVICRTGSIFKQADLEMCNILDAKSVIINENDMNTIKSLLVVVNTDFYKNGNGHICALMYDELNIRVAENIGKDKLEVIFLQSAITRIIAQTCLQPGLSYVYNELLEFAGCEIYFYKNKDLIGRNFGEVQMMFSQAIAIGIMRDGKPIIKPHVETIFGEDDEVILIAEDEDTAKVDLLQHPVDLALIKENERKTAVKQANIFAIGFNKKTLDVIEEFNNYLAKGSKINILVNSEEYLDQLNELDAKMEKVDIKTFVGDTYCRSVLDQYVSEDVTSIIIFSNENVEFSERDSQTLLSLLHLRDMEELHKTNFDIITEIADVKNSEIVDLAKVDDFIISELMANKMLTQVSENRHLKEIFNHLLSDEGSEIYLKPISDYVDIHTPVDFYTLVKAAQLKDEVAIGYKKSRLHDIPVIDINPEKKVQLTFDEHDCLIVISED